MQINDPKFIFILGVIVTTEQAIAGGAIHLTNMFPDAWIPTITAWCSFLSFVGTAFMTGLTGFSSSKVGPLSSASAPRNVPVIIALALVSALLLLLLSTTATRAAELAVPPPLPVQIGGVVGVGVVVAAPLPRHKPHRIQRR